MYIYWFILLNMISHIDSFTSQISSKYVPYSLHRSTDHIRSILGIILVVLYKVSHLIPHKHLIYFIRHSLYVHLYQDRTTHPPLSHAVLSPRTPNACQTPRGRQDNHTDTSWITSTLDGNHRPSDLFIEPVNTTPSYGKPYVHNTMDGQMSHKQQIRYKVWWEKTFVKHVFSHRNWTYY